MDGSQQPFQWPQPIADVLEALKAASLEDYLGDYWSARDLSKLLGYSTWQKFQTPIKRAMAACQGLELVTTDHFNPGVKMVVLGSGAKRKLEDIELTRFACYLIAQNGDPAQRPEIAAAQIYFAAQTLKHEHMEKALELEARREHDALRVDMRDTLKEHNKRLAEAGHSAGVKTPSQYRNFMGAGLKGLYGGLSKADIAERKGLEEAADHLNHAGHEELAALYFKATQAEAKIRREKISGPTKANAAHKEVGAAVRGFISDLGGVMPEDLAPEEDVEKVRRRLNAASVSPPLLKKAS